MKLVDLATLLTLAAIWGGSYLFLRLGAADFGPAPLAAVRAGGAALLMCPLLVRLKRGRELRAHWRALLLVGVVHSAVPYLLFSYAALTVSAGLAAILTATTPLFAGVIARLWFAEKLGSGQIAGLLLGLLGVAVLVSGRAELWVEGPGAGWAVGACLLGACFYATGAHCTKRYLQGVQPSVVAAGTQAAAALVLVGPALGAWPEVSPPATAWAAAGALAAVSTAFAYILFFRLVSRIGAARTVTVTFLIPVFGVLWGALFLQEQVTGRMLVGGAVILVGVACTTGRFRVRASKMRDSLEAPSKVAASGERL
jgi:drug/metabolite transporter (DMT)-like permease